MCVAACLRLCVCMFARMSEDALPIVPTPPAPPGEGIAPPSNATEEEEKTVEAAAAASAKERPEAAATEEEEKTVEAAAAASAKERTEAAASAAAAASAKSSTEAAASAQKTAEAAAAAATAATADGADKQDSNVSDPQCGAKGLPPLGLSTTDALSADDERFLKDSCQGYKRHQWKTLSFGEKCKRMPRLHTMICCHI